MNREDLVKQLEANALSGTRVSNIWELTADFILDNFTPKGEAEKVTAAKIYMEMIKRPTPWSLNFQTLSEYAHEAARSFNDYKPE